MPLNYTLDTLSNVLENILGPETTELIKKINEQPGSKLSPFMHLPDSSLGDYSSNDIARLVARASNEYGKACRLAGLARAQYKIAYAAYKHKFRVSTGSGKNKEERESVAVAASVVEYDKMVLLEAIVELCESIESSTRIASESARRMMLSADQISKADSRTDTFSESLPDTDFSPF